MNFEAIIGLELHIEMKTKSKMFSSAPVTFGDSPNTNVAPYDMAFPGTMPVVNKQAVVNAIRVCNALHMTIDNELWFDRKNYFYSDLPKGYQITQQRRPIGKDGYLEIENRKIGIERLHIEEDTCKQVHIGSDTLLDYNRAGIPLVEIVSQPEIKSGEEAAKFVEKIRSIVSFLNVSDGRMEKGSLRCDVNVSILPIGSQRLGKKVEIKNLNSISNIQKAIDFEIKRQIQVVLSGNEVKQETRRFDEAKKQTLPMRNKTDVEDYKCFTEPNILPIKLSKEFIEETINTSPELAEAKYQRYKGLGLNDYDATLLTTNKETSEYFDNVISNGVSPKLAANWIIVDVQAVLNKENKTIDEFSISPKDLASLISLIEKKTINNRQARELFAKIVKQESNLDSLVNNFGTTKLGEKELLGIIKHVLNDNPQSIIDYNNGKDRAVSFLVGKVLKASNGKADPELINRLILKELKVR